MSVGNKKVSQLVALTATEVAADDLFYIVDSSAKESKKIQANELSMYLSISGSLYVVSAVYANTASYVLGSNVHGTVASSSYSVVSDTSTSASFAWSSISASYARRSFTASYAHNAGGGTTLSSSYSDYALSSSHTLKADLTDNASIAAYLYYSGGDNGTASYAMKTGIVNRAILADTASYLAGGVGPTVSSASWSDRSGHAITASNANVATFLQYSPTNGTASYAISAGSTGNRMSLYGLTNAQTQSTDRAVISVLDVRSSYSSSQETMIDVYGNVILNFTASEVDNAYLRLLIYDRNTGVLTTGDRSAINFNTTPMQNKWDTLETGSFMTPFHLVAQQPMYGRYYLVVSSSSPRLQIDSASNRPVKFVFSSFSDNLSVVWDSDPLDVEILPTSSVITYYMTGSGPFTTDTTGLLSSGSNMVSSLDISSAGVTDVKYTFHLETMSFFNCNDNPSLTVLDYKFPDTLISFWASRCGLESIYSLSNTQLLDFSCSYCSMSYLPTLPNGLLYLDCGHNPLQTLPDLPDSLVVLIADFTYISASSGTAMPISLVSGSFSGSWLNQLPSPLPTHMKYLDIGSTGVVIMPTMPFSTSYFNASNAALTTTEIEDVTTDLVANGQLNGYMDLRGYGTFTSPTILTNISQLVLSGWTVLYDP